MWITFKKSKKAKRLTWLLDAGAVWFSRRVVMPSLQVKALGGIRLGQKRSMRLMMVAIRVATFNAQKTTQTAIKGNSAWFMGAPAGSSWSSPGKGGEVTQGRGAWVMSSPKNRTEYTRLRCVPSTPAEACRLSM